MRSRVVAVSLVHADRAVECLIEEQHDGPTAGMRGRLAKLGAAHQ